MIIKLKIKKFLNTFLQKSNGIKNESIISPILCKSKNGVFISTPIRKKCLLQTLNDFKEKKNSNQGNSKHFTENSSKFNYEYADFDLFEVWDTDIPQKKNEDSKNLIILPQTAIDTSADLFTTHNISIEKCAIENLFTESFNLSQTESNVKFSSGI